MSDDGRGLMLDFVEAHFRSEDEARSAYLDEAMKREPTVGDLCMRGHDEWVVRSSGQRRCLACHRERMAERRAMAKTRRAH